MTRANSMEKNPNRPLQPRFFVQGQNWRFALGRAGPALWRASPPFPATMLGQRITEQARSYTNAAEPFPHSTYELKQPLDQSAWKRRLASYPKAAPWRRSAARRQKEYPPPWTGEPQCLSPSTQDVITHG